MFNVQELDFCRKKPKRPSLNPKADSSQEHKHGAGLREKGQGFHAIILGCCYFGAPQY